MLCWNAISCNYLNLQAESYMSFWAKEFTNYATAVLSFFSFFFNSKPLLRLLHKAFVFEVFVEKDI